MNSILAERMALLAPFGKDRNLNQIERGMLLAELLGLAAKFENKVRQNKQWENLLKMTPLTFKLYCAYQIICNYSQFFYYSF